MARVWLHTCLQSARDRKSAAKAGLAGPGNVMQRPNSRLALGELVVPRARLRALVLHVPRAAFSGAMAVSRRPSGGPPTP